MASSHRAVLGLDIGGTKLAAAVVTADGQTHALTVQPTQRHDGPDRILQRLFDMGNSAIAASALDGIDAIQAVGISCGGPLDATAGVLQSPLHLPGWINVPIVAMAAREFDAPAVLENDATAAALGEFRYGAGVGVSTLLYLTISTGIGGGAVIDGRLHRGAAGNGGEYGHIMVSPGGRPCLCGRNGCLEAYASGTSIALRANEAVSAHPRSSLATLTTIKAEDVSSAAVAGDEFAVSLWNETTELLSVAITDLVNIFEPDLVVLGGGVTHAGDALLDPVRRTVLATAMKPAAKAARIQLAALGDAVCVVGAAALAFDYADQESGRANANPSAGTHPPETGTGEPLHV